MINRYNFEILLSSNLFLYSKEKYISPFSLKRVSTFSDRQKKGINNKNIMFLSMFFRFLIYIFLLYSPPTSNKASVISPSEICFGYIHQ